VPFAQVRGVRFANLRFALSIALVAGACSSPGDARLSDGGLDDGGSDAGEVPSSCDFDPALEFNRYGEILQLAGEDTCMRIERRDDCPAGSICKAVPYTLLEVRLGRGDRFVFVDDLERMSWESTHHNWSDTAEIDDQGTLYQLTYHYEDEFVDRYTLEASGEVSFGPIDLVPHAP
jgi:hypothetical protein